MNTDWHRDKSILLVQSEIKFQSTSRYPSDERGAGMLDAIYALGLIDEERHASLLNSLLAAVRNRRSELSAERIRMAAGG